VLGAREKVLIPGAAIKATEQEKRALCDQQSVHISTAFAGAWG
jgi:hypothetical protein